MASTFVPPRTGSRRSRVAAALTRALVKPLNDRVPANDIGLAVARQIVARSLAAFGPVTAGTDITPVDVTGPDGSRVRGEWVRAPAATRDDAVILYLHGSGYALCSPKTHRGLVSRLSSASGLAVFSLEYRLAPRHPLPRRGRRRSGRLRLARRRSPPGTSDRARRRLRRRASGARSVPVAGPRRA